MKSKFMSENCDDKATLEVDNDLRINSNSTTDCSTPPLLCDSGVMMEIAGSVVQWPKKQVAIVSMSSTPRLQDLTRIESLFKASLMAYTELSRIEEVNFE